ncbi:hypothetical protein [Nocardioides bruguierae]|uniref:Uncharacterized protein n=1 Tax=Nocardioides bruguierae TaxID=2945102 RepID=A0A9X2IGB8_9ACTN|nr:hypothetical protein [Nocardioides bruguierae]MCM0622731.1 hypothetical protein [Nocardioides bruguierae]
MTLPIADYDRLLLAQIERRLETLDLRDVNALEAHERGYMARPAALDLLTQRRRRLLASDAPNAPEGDR